MKYQLGFSSFGGDSCVKRDGGTSLESGVPSRLLLMYVLFVYIFLFVGMSINQLFSGQKD